MRRGGIPGPNTGDLGHPAIYTDKMTRRIGVHLGTAGGPSNAVLRAREIGANTLQIFSSRPRMWRPAVIAPVQAERTREFRAEYNIAPLAIHTSYLLNVCSQTWEVREKS